MKFHFVILVKNEELHIRRLLSNISPIASGITIVDSFSTDNTIEICKEFTNDINFRDFDYQAAQFNWVLNNLKIDQEWIIRLDADEYFPAESITQLSNLTISDLKCFNGIEFRRRYIFLGREIKYGGVFPHKVVRAFRYGYGKYEDRIMDEHLMISGKIFKMHQVNLIDENLNNLDWYLKKHIDYANREVNVCESERQEENYKLSRNAYLKRNLKKIIRTYLNGYLFSFIYFIYRYFVRGGFRDGSQGFIFHFIQGFFYRNLVQIKADLKRKSN